MMNEVLVTILLYVLVLTGRSYGQGYVACHIPLEPWNPVQSRHYNPPFDIEAVDLSPCNEVILSTANNLFRLPLTAASIIDVKNLERFVHHSSKLPRLSFTLSMLPNSSVFPDLNINDVLGFMTTHKMTGLDVYYELLEDFTGWIPVLGETLHRGGRRFSVTVNDRVSSSLLVDIASEVDVFHVVPDCNRFYSNCQDNLVDSYSFDTVTDTMELGIGRFLHKYLSLGLPKDRLVIGVPIDSIIWQTGGEFIWDTTKLRRREGIKRIMRYKESCDFTRMGWREVLKNENHFSRTLIAPCFSVWTFQVDESLLVKKLSLLLHYGFDKFVVYDTLSDDYELECSSSVSSNKTFPMTNAAYDLVTGKSQRDVYDFGYNETTPATSYCIPFYNFTYGCSGYFGY